MQTIIFNGKTYKNIEDMPANERQAFEQMTKMFVDANGNGIPDFLEGDVVKNVVSAHSAQTNINVNGQTYHSFNELPPELRQQVDGAFQMLSNIGVLNGTPEAPSQDVKARSKMSTESQTSSVIEEDRGNSVFTMVLGGIVLCFAIAVLTIAGLYFMSR